MAVNPLPSAEWALQTHRIGRRVLVFDRVESTNSLALSYSHHDANDGLVILAHEQTAGRGKPGRTWLSPAGTGICMSVVLFPPEAVRRAVVLTVLAAVAVCESIYQFTKLQARIKWPNDVLVRGKKVCGILVEQSHATTIGIGVNVNTSAAHFAGAGLAGAASLALLTGRTFPMRSITETLIEQLDAGYQELCNGRWADIEAKWRWHSGLPGKQVRLRSKRVEYQGRLTDMAFDGIVLQPASGLAQRFQPEHIEAIADC